MLLSILEYADVFSFQIANEAPVLVSGGKEDVRQIGFDFDDFVRVLAIPRDEEWARRKD